MARVKEGYLYIIQLRSDVEQNRNVFKFGRTDQNPPWKRFDSGYEKDCRVWLLIIMNDTVFHEQAILELLRKKYKTRTDKGVEYFEVDDVREMIDLVMEYHKKHFKNIYLPMGEDVEFDGAQYFNDSKDRILHNDPKKELFYIKSCDANSDFSFWLQSKGWAYQPKRRIIFIGYEDYDKFLQDVSDSGDSDDVRTYDVEEPTITIRPNIESIPEIKFNGLKNSMEAWVNEFEPYFKANHLKPSNVAALFNISTTTRRELITINSVELFNEHNESIIKAKSISDIITVPEPINPSFIKLTPRKRLSLERIKQPNVSNYNLIIPSFELKTFQRRRGKPIKYIDFEFQRVME